MNVLCSHVNIVILAFMPVRTVKMLESDVTPNTDSMLYRMCWLSR